MVFFGLGLGGVVLGILHICWKTNEKSDTKLNNNTFGTTCWRARGAHTRQSARATLLTEIPTPKNITDTAIHNHFGYLPFHGAKTADWRVVAAEERDGTRQHEHMGESLVSSGDTQTLDTCQLQLTLSHLSVSFSLTLPSATRISTRSRSAVNPYIQGATSKKKKKERLYLHKDKKHYFSPLCHTKCKVQFLFFFYSLKPSPVKTDLLLNYQCCGLQ